ncbi:unnamed protein product [Clavelina lepadiformis]|uniref:Uncharacterized protein n=1 Tax=Clavelina lepadiformis TaxID=159417 RepID=A0ABP0FBP4_CLALP
MATIWAAFGKTLGNNKGSVQNFGIVGVTIATEELAKFVFFYCPCNYPFNKVYGSIFIWGPAVILLIAGYLANRRTWRLMTGLCNRTQGVGKRGKRIFHFIFIFLSIGVKAIIAPATWVVLAFLKGDYYACAKWPDPDDVVRARIRFNLKPSNDSLPRPCMFKYDPRKFDASEPEIIARDLRAESHAVGWFYVTIGMTLGVVIMLYKRCKENYSYEQRNYIDRYRSNEIELFEDTLDKKAKEQAQRIVEGYFTKPRAKEEWDQIAVINDKVTRSKRGRAIYSPLHKFVNKEIRAREDAEPIEDIVSDAAMKKVSVPKMENKSLKQGGGGTTIIPLVPLGGRKTKIVKKPPVELKTDAFVGSPDTKKSAEPKSAGPPPEAKPTTNTSKVEPKSEKPHVVPAVVIVDPTAPKDLVTHTKASVSSDQSQAVDSKSKSPQPSNQPQEPTTSSNLKETTSPKEDETGASSDNNALKDEDHEALPESQKLASGDAAKEHIPPAIPPPPRVENPTADNKHPSPVNSVTQEETFNGEESDLNQPKAAVMETSLGDFGGSVSREDLRLVESSSDDERAGTIVFEGQNMPECQEEPDGPSHEGYIPLLENGDDTQLLLDD